MGANCQSLPLFWQDSAGMNRAVRGRIESSKSHRIQVVAAAGVGIVAFIDASRTLGLGGGLLFAVAILAAVVLALRAVQRSIFRSLQRKLPTGALVASRAAIRGAELMRFRPEWSLRLLPDRLLMGTLDIYDQGFGWRPVARSAVLGAKDIAVPWKDVVRVDLAAIRSYLPADYACFVLRDSSELLVLLAYPEPIRKALARLGIALQRARWNES
jgi:hypothetical protein